MLGLFKMEESLKEKKHFGRLLHMLREIIVPVRRQIHTKAPVFWPDWKAMQPVALSVLAIPLDYGQVWGNMTNTHWWRNMWANVKYVLVL